MYEVPVESIVHFPISSKPHTCMYMYTKYMYTRHITYVLSVPGYVAPQSYSQILVEYRLTKAIMQISLTPIYPSR